uniref:DUF4378 domain-containing protein n=1 Tax=Kalanchoe fedtschenkoi TaxID=63787 RepID=A0A7N0USX5_KALFE
MGKIPHRRIIRSEKDHIGCMWGFISIFYFRRGGYHRKLLADKRSGNKVLSGIGGSQNIIRNLKESDYQLDDEDCESTQPMLRDGKVSVKKLMEEDMVVEKKRKQNSNDAENQDSDFQCQSLKRSSSAYQQKRKYSPVSSDMDLANDADIDNLVREIFSRIQQRSVEHEEEEMDNFCVLLEKKHAKFEKQLIEATKVILRGKLISGMPLGQDGKIHYSKEFMDAVDALVSHKELFFKLLEDPNSKLTRRINNLLNAEQGKSDNLKESHGPHHRKHHHLFSRRRVRSQEEILLSDNESSEAPYNNNAILDPGSEASSASISVKSCESSLKTKSLFSFTEIKRKLKHAMGKDREGVSTKNEMVKRISRGNQSRETVGRMSLSPSRNPHLEAEIHPKRLSSPRRSDISGVERSEMNSEYEISSPSKQKMSNSSFLEPHHIHKHSSHVLTDENDPEKFYERELAKKSACTPDRASSPTFSPARKSSCSSPYAHVKLSSPRKSLNSNADSQVLEQANNLNVAEDLSAQSELDDTLSPKLESWDPSPIISILGDGEDVSRSSVEMSLEGNVKDLLLQTTEKLSKNESAHLGISVYKVEDEGDATEVFEAEAGTAAAFDEQDKNYGDFTASPKAPCSDKMEQFGDLTSRLDRPSPVSVLEPVYLDGEISPAPTEMLPGELPVAPLKIYFDEDDLPESDKSVVDKKQPCHDNESKQKYIKEILTASGFSWNKFYLRSLSSDQLLDTSLYDAELDIHSDQAPNEYKLLFDCTNGVVMDLCARYFGGSPLTPLSKYRPIPDTKIAFQEIWEGLEWHLRPLSPPWSLEQIVAKDLARDGRWMDLRSDADTIGTEIEDMILQELVEDTVMSCFSEECTDDEASSAMMSVTD